MKKKVPLFVLVLSCVLCLLLGGLIAFGVFRQTVGPEGMALLREQSLIENRFVGDYSAVEFTFFRTNEPFRMLRLAEIDFGVSRHFDRDSIGEMRIRYGLSPDASAFPAKEFVFTFDE